MSLNNNVFIMKSCLLSIKRLYIIHVVHGSRVIRLFFSLSVYVSPCLTHCFCGAKMRKMHSTNFTCILGIGLRIIVVVAMTCLFASLINKCLQLSTYHLTFEALKILSRVIKYSLCKIVLQIQNL
jgi:hypothetical protein